MMILHGGMLCPLDILMVLPWLLAAIPAIMGFWRQLRFFRRK